MRRLALVGTFLGLCGISSVRADEPVTLRVALYPYVPEAHDLFFRLERAFESANPGVNLELVETFRKPNGKTGYLADEYYKGGLEATEADVYEVDTILLRDLAKRKLQPVTLPTREFVAFAGKAAVIDGDAYGVPHWVCGNFLFFRKSDTAIRDAKTWEDVEKAVPPGTRSGGLVVDLRGSLTLGEWYLIALSLFVSEDQLPMAAAGAFDPRVIKPLTDILGTCPTGLCRSRGLHNRTGYYARLFARGSARAYIGYSESSYYALREVLEDCTPTSGCISPEEIAVRALPGSGTPTLGWVDVLSLDRELKGQKLLLAKKFVDFMTSWDAYATVLKPDWGSAPRYLLPAVTLTPEQLAILGAPLYEDFVRAFANRFTVSAAGMNSVLQSHAKMLDCALPIDRDDAETIDGCKPKQK